MSKQTEPLPPVAECAIDACTYNVNHECHAKAITIGNEHVPTCDTLNYGKTPVRDTEIQAGVGACKIAACSFNRDLECAADRIHVGLQGTGVRCLTFTLA